MDKVYHIYAKDKCIISNINEDEFSSVWDTIKNMVGIMKTEYTPDDLSYEELEVNREVYRESSH